LLILAVLVPPCHAERYYFQYYGGTAGLSQAVPQAIYQDRAGFIWVGTQAGLNCYDGDSWTIYSIRQGLSNDWINSITEDNQGHLWVGTLGGVSRWDGSKFTNYTSAEGLADNRVVWVTSAKDGIVWAATTKGVCRFDGTRWITYTVEHGLPSEKVHSLYLDHADTLWVATQEGVAFLRGQKFIPFRPGELAGQSVSSITEDTHQRLYVGLQGRLLVYDRMELLKTFSAAEGFPPVPASRVLADRYGVVWAGTPQGLVSIRGEKISLLTEREGLQHSDVRAVFEDREGVLWIGCYGGLYKFQGRAFTNYLVADGLGSDNVRPIVRDRQGSLWVGTTNGLSRLQGGEWKNFTTDHGLLDNAVQALLLDRKGLLWVGLRTGLCLFDGSEFTRDTSLTPYGRVVGIAEDPRGTIWCTVQPGGLFRKVQGRFEMVSVPGQSFSNGRVLVDKKGSVWVSGDMGLSRWDGRTWTTFTTRDGLASNQPYFMCNDARDRIWFGYHSSSGLTYYDGTRFAHYTTAEGLSNDAVYSLGVDQAGNLWVGTARGVNRFDGSAFTQFGTEEGLANNESNAGGFYADRDGTLWFGTIGGLSHYDPRFDLSTGAPPALKLAELRLGSQRLTGGAAPDVAHNMNDLVARVVGLSFVNERRLNFEYRLLGFHEEWNPLEGKEIRITNLPARSYTLEVRARKYQGAWSQAVGFGFRIRPPFWNTWWFWLLALSVVAPLVYVIYELKSARVRRRAAELEQKIEDRTRELAQKTEELESFIYTISHDLKAPVVSLQGLASLLKLDLGDQLQGDAALYLERIHANTVHMQRLINELLKLSRIGRLKEPRVPVDMNELVHETARELHGQVELKKATITIDGTLPTVVCEKDRMQQVWMNLLANALHYSRPEVSPVISVGATNGEVDKCTLYVRDNGIGIAPEYQEKVFDIFYRVDGKYADSESTGVGLAIVKRIIDSHGGTVWVESGGRGMGTTFWFTLPQ
jgi:signal transduction histidine kinase/ligand-binding sensor domain-containing protein